MNYRSIFRQRSRAFISRTFLGLAVAGSFVIGLGVLNVPQASAVAGINQTVNFQGRLLNAAGAVVADGNYNMRFKIYQDGDGATAGNTTGSPVGALKWTELWQNSVASGSTSAVVVKNGYFSVNLGTYCVLSGSSCQGNTNTAIDFNQDTLFLSMDVGGTAVTNTPTYDGELLPMRRLASSIYALQADNANKLGGLTSAAFLQTTPGSSSVNVIAPVTASTVALTVKGTTSTSANVLEVFNSNATPTRQAFFDANGALNVAQTIQPTTTNTVDLGLSATTFRTGYFGTSVVTPAITSATNSNISLTPGGTGDVVVNTDADSNLQVTASAVPTVDQLAITNAGQGVTAAGVNNLSLNFVGGAGAIEAGSQRIDLQPGTTSGSVWNGLRVVQNATGPTTGVTSTGVKLEGPTTAGAGTYNAVNIANIGATTTGGTVRGINITGTNSQTAGTVQGININNITAGGASETAINLGTGWDNLLTYNGATVVVNGSGQLNLGQVTGTLVATNGGTGQSAYTVGDMLYANSTTSLAKLAAVATGSCLISQGTGTAPVWGSCTGGGTYLAKNANDTSSASFLGALLALANTNAGAAGVLSLANSGTNSALSVSASANPTSGQALVFANNTNGAPTGNLLDLQSSSASKFSVNAAGSVTLAGGQTIDSSSTIGIGSATATTLTLGRSGQTVSVPGILAVNGSYLNINNTLTSSNPFKLGVQGNISSSSTTNQYGIQNQVDFTPSGASLGSLYGMVNLPSVGNSSTANAVPVGNAYGLYSRIDSGSQFTGGITVRGVGLMVDNPTLNATTNKNIPEYDGILIGSVGSTATDNGGNTTGTLVNAQLKVGSLSAAAASGGTINNYGVYLNQPNGAGAGTTNNYGLYLTGNGGGSSNYAIYSTSTAASQLNGSLQTTALTATGLSTAGIVTNTSGGALGTVAAVPAVNGGTGQTGYTIGDLLYASSATALGKLAAVASGSCLVSAGTATAPVWGSCNTNTAFTVAGTSGTNQTISNGDTLTIAAGSNISTTGGATDTITVAVASSPLFTGAVTTGTTLQVGNTANQSIQLGSGAGSHGIEIGRTDGTASTPFIDFHSFTSANDFDGRIIVSGGGAGNGLGTLNLTASAVQSAAIITFSNLSAAGIVTNTSGGQLGTVAAVPATNGGTGQTGYTIGDLLYANSTTSLAKLADVATGSCLISGGVGVAPSWGSCGGGGGANVTLSNLTGPTAINQDLTFAAANRQLTVATQGTAATAGNNLTVIAATGNTTGAGGVTAVTGGTGGTSGNGGATNITGGAAGGGNTNGGNVTISGGAKAGTGAGGSVIVKPQASNDSATAFQVQNAAGTGILTVDSSATAVTILGATTINATGSSNIAIGNSATGLTNISGGTTTLNSNGSLGLNSGGATTITATGTFAVTGSNFAVSTAGYVTLGTGAGLLTPNITSPIGADISIRPAISTAASATGATVDIQGANSTGTTSTGGNVFIDAGTGTSNNGTITMGTVAKSINIGSANTTQLLNIQVGATNTVQDTTIVIGGNSQSAPLNSVSIGTLGGSQSVTTLKGGSGSTALGLQVASGGTITVGANANSLLNIGTGTFTHTIALGTGAAVQGITIGSNNTTSQTTIEGGATAANSIAIGNGGTVHNIQIGTSASAAQTLLMGSVGASSATTIEGLTLNVGTATSSAHTIAIGNGASAIQGITVGSVFAGSTTLVEGPTLNIGTGTSTAHTIAIGTGSSAIQGVAVGSTNSTSTTAISGGTGATAVSIAAGSGGTINIANTGVANTVQIGTTTSAVAQTLNIGTNATAGSTNTVNIGNSATNSINALNIGSTNSTSTTAIKGGTGTNALALSAGTNGSISAATTGTGNITLSTNNASAGTYVKSTTNTQTAFQVQNAGGQTILGVDTGAVAANLVTNNGFEVSTTGWAAVGTGASIARNTNRGFAYNGLNSLDVTLGSVANTGAQITSSVLFGAPLAAGSYNFSFFAEGSAALTGLAAVLSGGGTCTLNASTVSANGFQRYSCAVTTTGTTSSINITAATTGQHLYIDSVQLTSGSTLAPFQIGALEFRGLVISPIQMQSASNSTQALTVYNNTAGSVFNVDTTTSSVSVQGATANSASTFVVKDGLGFQRLAVDTVANRILIGSTGFVAGLTAYANASNGFVNNIASSAITADRTFTLPDITGTGAIIQAATPGTQQTGNMNISGTILAGAFDFAGVQSIGQTSATSINIGKTGSNIATTVYGTELVKSPSNATQVFQVQDSSANTVLTVDTSSRSVGIFGVGSGTGVRNANRTLEVDGNAPSCDYCANVGFDSSLQLPNTAAQYGFSHFANVSPTSASTSGFYVGNHFQLDVANANVGGTSALTVLNLVGQNTTTSTVSEIAGLHTTVNNTTTGTITKAMGLYVQSNNGGTIGTNYGIYQQYQSIGATDYALYFEGGGVNPMFTVTGDGATTFRNYTNTANALAVLNTAGTQQFNVDTSNSRVIVGTTAGDATGTILVLGNKTGSAADPTGVAGAMYYNVTSGDFRCYSDHWQSCLQSARTSWHNTDDMMSASGSVAAFSGLVGGADLVPGDEVWGWNQNPSGTGSLIHLDTATTGHPGINQLQTGTSATNGGITFFNPHMGVAGSGGSLQLGNGDYWRYETEFRMPTVSDATNRYLVTAGFTDGYDDGGATDGCLFKLIDNVNAGKGTGTCTSNGTASTPCNIGTTTAPTANQWLRVTVVVNSAGTQATFTVQNITAGTAAFSCNVTTNIPTGAGRQTSYEFGISKSAGTTSRSVDVDYIELEAQFGTGVR